MKTKKLDYDFNIRSIKETKLKHDRIIKKLKKEYKNELKNILNDVELILEDEILNTFFANNYNYNLHQLNQFKKERKQKHLKSLKSAINNIARNYITFLLKCKNIPASYATAFYCIYYAKINAIMKKELKNLVKNY